MPPYAARNDTESSSESDARFCESAIELKSRPLRRGVSVCVRRQGRIRRRGEVPDEPYETFGRGVFLRLQFVEHELLEGFGVGGGCELSVPDFLRGWSCQEGPVRGVEG